MEEFLGGALLILIALVGLASVAGGTIVALRYIERDSTWDADPMVVAVPVITILMFLVWPLVAIGFVVYGLVAGFRRLASVVRNKASLDGQP
jgi:hypothetical protein